MSNRAAVWVVCGCVLAYSGGGRAEERKPSVEATRATLEKWVETRRLISKEREEWVLGREVLNGRVEVVQREIEGLREKIAATEKEIADADATQEGRVRQKALLEEAAGEFSIVLVTLEARTLDLLKRLPDPLREKVKPFSQAIPAAAEETKLGIPARFQSIVAVLNEVNKFNREITVTSELRRLDGGETAEVTTMYVGIGQAYYATADKKHAGFGWPTADGWQWSPADEAAAEIARAIAVFNNEEPAAFVKLPVRAE